MNDKSPTVSIILPTYNRAHVLGRAIQSVLDQTFPDFELIIIDDGSSDNTTEIINSFQDPRIRYLKHHTNRGVSAARNTGIKVAEGKYIAFQDSDDEWLPQKLEEQIKVFLKDTTGELGLVTCGQIFVSGDNVSFSMPEYKYLNYKSLLHRKKDLPTGTVRLVINSSLAGKELYFDEDLPALVDWDLAFRLSRILRFDYVPKYLVKAYSTKNATHVRSPSNVLKARLFIINKYRNELGKRPVMLSRHHEMIAMSYYRLADFPNVRCHLLTAIKIFPWRPITYIYLFFSLFGSLGFNFFFTKISQLGKRISKQN